MYCVSNPEIPDNNVPKLRKLLVVGIRASKSFQKSRSCVEKLHKCFPEKYEEPEIRPMFNLEWDEYLTMIRREIGKATWQLKKPVAIFLDGVFLGSDEALFKDVDDKFDGIGDQDVFNYISNKINEGHKFAFISVAVDHKVIGAMLFELYNEFLPVTCANFLERCESEEEDSYRKTPIHRIVKNGWIQCGGWKLEEKKMPCENYIIPHDRRGVLSMCNRRRHRDNTTQFYITLTTAPWMDYRYVAFGQLIQGVELLKFLENQSTYYQSPRHQIEIFDCGEFTPFEQHLCHFKDLLDVDKSLDEFVDNVSIMKESKYRQGKYCLLSDLKSYFPFMHLPEYMISAYLIGKPPYAREVYEGEMSDRSRKSSRSTITSSSSTSCKSDQRPIWIDFDPIKYMLSRK